MSYSTTPIECQHCNTKFTGVLENELFKIDKKYAATCPKCENKTFIKNIAGIIADNKPSNSSQLYFVE